MSNSEIKIKLEPYKDHPWGKVRINEGVDRAKAQTLVNCLVSGTETDASQVTVLYYGKHYALVRYDGSKYWGGVGCGQSWAAAHVNRVPTKTMLAEYRSYGDQYPKTVRVWESAKGPDDLKGRTGRLNKNRLISLIRETMNIEEAEEAAGPCKRCGGHIWIDAKFRNSWITPSSDLCLKTQCCLKCSRKVANELAEKRKEDERKKELAEAKNELPNTLTDTLESIGKAVKDAETQMEILEFEDWSKMVLISERFLKSLDSETIKLKKVLRTLAKKN